MPTANISFSLISNGSCGVTNGVNGNLTDPTHTRFQLGALMGNPAFYPLMAGSIAINAGNNALAVDSSSGSPVPLTLDERGAARIFAGQVDMGAYEAHRLRPTPASRLP